MRLFKRISYKRILVYKIPRKKRGRGEGEEMGKVRGEGEHRRREGEDRRKKRRRKEEGGEKRESKWRSMDGGKEEKIRNFLKIFIYKLFKNLNLH